MKQIDNYPEKIEERSQRWVIQTRGKNIQYGNVRGYYKRHAKYNNEQIVRTMEENEK